LILCHKETVELGTYFVRRKKKKKKEKEKKKNRKPYSIWCYFSLQRTVTELWTQQ